MISNTILSNLPHFDEDVVDSRFVYQDKDFQPFVKLRESALFFALNDILSGIGMSSSTAFSLVYHSLNAPAKLHFHDYLEICYIVEGRLVHIINHEPIIMSAGDLSIIPVGDEHLLAPFEDKKPVVIDFLFHPDLIQKLNQLTEPLSIFEKATHFHFNHPSESYSVEQTLTNFLDEFVQARCETNLNVLGSLIQFLASLNQIETKKSTNPIDPLTSACLNFIRLNASTITQKQIAHALSYSSSYLSRHIRKTTGRTISQHITEEKLKLAQRLLATTSLAINEIADQIGYSSESHFYRIFKKQYQITPSHYRKLMVE